MYINLAVCKYSPILLALASLFSVTAKALPPQLYRQPAYESPVRGDPDDVLMLAGYGFAAGDEVVYRAGRLNAAFPDSSLGSAYSIYAKSWDGSGRQWWQRTLCLDY